MLFFCIFHPVFIPVAHNHLFVCLLDCLVSGIACTIVCLPYFLQCFCALLNSFCCQNAHFCPCACFVGSCRCDIIGFRGFFVSVSPVSLFWRLLTVIRVCCVFFLCLTLIFYCFFSLLRHHLFLQFVYLVDILLCACLTVSFGLSVCFGAFSVQKHIFPEYRAPCSPPQLIVLTLLTPWAYLTTWFAFLPWTPITKHVVFRHFGLFLFCSFLPPVTAHLIAPILIHYYPFAFIFLPFLAKPSKHHVRGNFPDHKTPNTDLWAPKCPLLV